MKRSYEQQARFFDSLEPQKNGCSKAPPEDDSGENEGDAMFSEFIEYGATAPDGMRLQDTEGERIAFAIRLGRALERRDMQDAEKTDD